VCLCVCGFVTLESLLLWLGRPAGQPVCTQLCTLHHADEGHATILTLARFPMKLEYVCVFRANGHGLCQTSSNAASGSSTSKPANPPNSQTAKCMHSCPVSVLSNSLACQIVVKCQSLKFSNARASTLPRFKHSHSSTARSAYPAIAARLTINQLNSGCLTSKMLLHSSWWRAARVWARAF
jgi:hypothetical protein